MVNRLFLFHVSFCLLTIVVATPGHTEEVCGPTTPAEELVVKLQQENSLLSTRVTELESRRSISEERLLQKKVLHLKGIAADTKLQRQSMESFQGFVSWMDQNLAGYTKYIKASSYAAVVGRMLPIPYAGQASIFTKFAAQFTVALNNASAAMNAYLLSSQKFLTMADEIDPSQPIVQKNVSDVSAFADKTLLKDMNDAQTKLATVSDLSSGALSFLESLNHYMSSTDEYWNKAKGMFKKDVDPKERSFISESTNSLKNKATAFNSKLSSFDELARKQNARVKSLTLYDELLSELPAQK
ncbi:MAG: hypothetical protein PHI31_02500 [Desulfuromonadaceae bacterium]|nr:hypothetical protein [Desulfuromonadaceae bacterium]